MLGLTRRWIVAQLSLGKFDTRRNIWRIAVVMACKLSLLAYGLNLAIHFGLHELGLLPGDLGPQLITATLVTPPIAFSISGAVYLAVGYAIHELGVSRAEFERLSRTDMLSGLANRRAFQQAFDECLRDKSMLVVDIDRFKSVNDSYGHSAGDTVIAQVAGKLASVFGERCLCARIGGEEFAIFSADMAFAEFAALAEIARTGIAAMRLSSEAGEFTVTVSVGVARALPDQKFGETFTRADKALYAAKSGGRDRVVLSYETGPPEQAGTSVSAA